MTAEERQHRLEAYLQKVEFASLDELAQHVGVSSSTVRRDLTILEERGSVRRTHGGARLLNPRSDEFTFSARDTHQLDEKESMGRLCAGLIRPRQSVIIDAGTTCHHVARYLEGQTLQIVTNSLPVANLFAASQRIEVVLSGGVIYPRLGVLVGPLAVETFKKTHADVAIMSAGGITLEGITNSHALLIDIQRAMIDAASKVIFCLDHTKFGRQSVAHLCELDRIDAIVTDGAAPAELVKALRGKGVEVLIASTDTPSSMTASVPPPASTESPHNLPRPRPARVRPEPLERRLSQGEPAEHAVRAPEVATSDVSWD
jgi:DeoR/GlpR family transcriptional regulator of sugar metabolism